MAEEGKDIVRVKMCLWSLTILCRNADLEVYLVLSTHCACDVETSNTNACTHS